MAHRKASSSSITVAKILKKPLISGEHIVKSDNKATVDELKKMTKDELNDFAAINMPHLKVTMYKTKDAMLSKILEELKNGSESSNETGSMFHK